MTTFLPSLLFAVMASVADAGDVDRAVRSFFTAYAGGDVTGAVSHWTGDGRDAFASKAAIVTSARCMRLDAVEITAVDINETTARAHVTTKITAWNAIDGATPRQLHEQRTLHLAKTAEGWRITKWSTEEEDALARGPVAFATVPRTPAMAVLLAESAINAANRGSEPDARRTVDLAFSIAAETGDPGAISVALSAESSILRLFNKSSDGPAAEALAFAEASGDADVIALALLRRGRSLSNDHGPTKRALFRRVLALADHLTDPSTAALAATQLAIEANGRSDFRDEMRHALIAYRYAEISGNRTALLSAMMNAAGCYYHQADWQLALTHFTRVLELARELRYPAVETHAMRRMAACHKHLGNREQAMSLLDDALVVAESSCWRDAVAEVHAEKAAHLLSLEKLAEAEQEAVAALRHAVVSDVEGEIAGARSLYAEIAYRRGRHEEARSIAVHEQSSWSHLIAGRALHRLGRMDDAEWWLQHATNAIESTRRLVLASDRQQQTFLEQHFGIYVAMVDLLIDRGEIVRAWETAQRYKARVLREAVERNGAEGMSLERDQAAERRLTDEIETLNAALLAGGQPEQIASIRAELTRVRIQLDDLISRTQGTQASYSLMNGTPPAGNLVRGLGDAVVLDYVAGPERTVVFVIRSDGSITARSIPVTLSELWRRAGEVRSAIQQRNLRAGEVLQSLRELLFAPVEQDIAGARLLCIVPAGPLWHVPFHALRDAAGRYEIENRAIVYAPSMELLGRQQQSEPRGKPTLLAFGNPNIRAETAARYRALDPGGTLGALPEVEEEVRRVAELYGQDRGRAYIGDAAREAVLKREAPLFDVLHIATHGLVDARAPMFSALVLSTAPGEGEDGLLEAREIAGLKLGTRIAVLSACDTGRGQVTHGEGVIGLSWALLAAGCPTAVVSQWKAVSSTTSTMMIDFHRHLVGGADAPEALRNAQLALRRDPRYSHPFYWAPFVVLGAPR